MIPFITSFENVQITVQTDQVTNIPVFFYMGPYIVWYQRWCSHLFR